MITENGFILENNVKLPFLGFGTYKVTERTEEIVSDALEAGYRHLDTARMYGNEKEIGNAIKNSGIRRRDLFLTTKVWKDDLGYDNTLRSFEASLNDLGVQYLDLFLIHWPKTTPESDWKPVLTETWKAMERLYEVLCDIVQQGLDGAVAVDDAGDAVVIGNNVVVCADGACCVTRDFHCKFLLMFSDIFSNYTNRSTIWQS